MVIVVVVMVVANKIIDGKSHFCPRCLVALSITLTIPAWLQAENTTRPWSGFKPRIVFTKIIIIIITNININIIIVIIVIKKGRLMSYMDNKTGAAPFLGRTQDPAFG